MHTVAIIPARGGSKGVPRKNLAVVNRLPLIARSVRAAMFASMVDQVFVSTDDGEIAMVATEYGATVIMRPKALATDESLSEEAILHVLGVIDRPDTIVFLQCTSPFTTSSEINKAVETFFEQKADSLVSVVPTHGFLWGRNPDGSCHAINHDATCRPRRQDLKPQYLENGAIYVMNAKKFMEYRHRFFGRTVMFEMTPDKWLEIDTPYDLFLAETLGYAYP